MSIVSATKTVTTAGTQVALVSAEKNVTSIVIQANPANTGYIYVGASDVDSSNGIRLSAAEKLAITCDDRNQGGDLLDLNKLYVDSNVNGEGVRFMYITPRS